MPKDSTYGQDSEVKLWSAGTSCICLKEKTVFMLNNKKEWTKVTVDFDEETNETPSENTEE